MSSHKRRVAVVTGTRAEFGLLRPVMQTVASHQQLQLQVIVAGAHLLPPAQTIQDVQAHFTIDAQVPMQQPGEAGRLMDAAALGRGILGFADAFKRLEPEVVVVLGDRIEAFGAAASAAIAGIRVAHIHGGDRAEGVADESMRHAITKLAHIHLPATTTSGQRIIAMGEDPARVHVVGSPALDGLSAIHALDDRRFESLGQPSIVVLLHPVGDTDDAEADRTRQLLQLAMSTGPTLALHPNHDPGRHGIMRAIETSAVRHIPHLDRDSFFGLLRRAKVLIGNSSAGLIEAAAAPIRCINVGPRQAGREKPPHAVNIPDWDYQTIAKALRTAFSAPSLTAADVAHPYGDGRAATRIADILASFDAALHPVRKLNTY